MALYSDKIAGLSRDTAHNDIDKCAAVGRAVTFVCGCYAAFSIGEGFDSDRTGTIGYASNGCGYMIAAAEYIAAAYENMPLESLHGLGDEIYQAVESELGTYPPERRHCLDCCVEALRNAFAELRARKIEEFRGEEALICTCFGITESRIEKIIAAHCPIDADRISEICNAGSGCGSCRMLIEEMIAAETSG